MPGSDATYYLNAAWAAAKSGQSPKQVEPPSPRLPGPEPVIIVADAAVAAVRDLPKNDPLIPQARAYLAWCFSRRGE